jgi:DivIVA domain-containing protein
VVTIVLGLVGIAVVVGVALLAVGRLGELPPAPSGLPPLDVPAGPMKARDVDDVRFAVGVRGYRMDEVDEVLDKVSVDLASRDARIAALEEQLAGVHPVAAEAPWETGRDTTALPAAPLGDPLPLDRAWPPAHEVDPGTLPPPSGA